ncbi:MAG: hypothetical protein GX575_13285 [Candidatus Anammoximicrobium sp.]|nr:hypothetical protein [Candidatus Anammoximicrobium sp.]
MAYDRNCSAPDKRDEPAVPTNPAESPVSPPSGRWAGRLAISIALAITLGPVLYFGLPAEVARWHVAAATEMWLDGKKPEALARLERALQWAEDSAATYACRADWMLEDEQFDRALADYDMALTLEPTNLWALIQRSEVLQHLGRHAEAIRDWKKLVDRQASASADQRAVFLNGLAYAQSLDTAKDPELDEALGNASQALNLAGQDAAILDTRGYIQYRRGDLKAAEADLNLAVTGMELQHKQFEQTRQYTDQREFARQLKKSRKSLAVIRYHRALVYDALGMTKEADADRQRVRELGFDPAPHLF